MSDHTAHLLIDGHEVTVAFTFTGSCGATFDCPASDDEVEAFEVRYSDHPTLSHDDILTIANAKHIDEMIDRAIDDHLAMEFA